MKFKQDVTRECSLFSVKAWYEGESKELEKWLGFGFFNHIFVSENGVVTLYYNIEEGDKFYEMLEEKFTKEFFDRLCEYFFEVIEKIDNVKSNEEIFDLSIKMWPALTLFDELSKYSDFGDDDMIRRLIRVRKSTENCHYELEKKINIDDLPKNYIFFRGEIYFMPFDNFIKEKGFEIIE